MCICKYTSAVPVLNLPVWNGLLSWPFFKALELLQNYSLSLESPPQFYNTLSLCCCLYAAHCHWCRVKLENFPFILPGLSAVTFFHKIKLIVHFSCLYIYIYA